MRPRLLASALVASAILGALAFGSLIGPGPARRATLSVAPSQQFASATNAASANRAAVSPSAALPSPTPTLLSVPIDWPAPSAPAVDPAVDDDLPLAGRGTTPGLLSCGIGLPFTVRSLENPTGAENKVGPEYDALREFLDVYATLGEFRRDPEVREVAHSGTSVMLFVDQRALPGSGFPHVPVSMDLIDGRWMGYDGVDCIPRAVVPPGFEPATWMIDPSHSAPTAKTRALHILVTERACASGKSASGRVGPAYVVVSEYEMSIGVVVQPRPGGQDCPSNPPTPARLSLPEPVGDRVIRDMYDYLLNGTGG